MGILAKFFALFWGWADYRPKDWSRAPTDAPSNSSLRLCKQGLHGEIAIEV
jgi:hypothetical protein